MRAWWNLSLIDLIKLNTLPSAQLFSQPKINRFPSRSNQPSSLPLELTEQFTYEGKIDFKLIKNQLCEAKMSVMRVGSRTPATSKMDLFVTAVKE